MSDSTFDSTKQSLKVLLEETRSGALQLPDFQRGWVWDDHHIRDLLASVSRSFPIGAVMMLESGGESRFRTRLIEGNRLEPVPEPKQLILDGQQRLTSLFQSLVGETAVATKDPKGNRIDRWYYIDINEALDTDVERVDAIIAVPEDKVIRTNFGRDVVADYTTSDAEYEARMFPVSCIFDPYAWRAGFNQHWNYDPDMVKLWDRFEQQVVSNFASYQLPVITLGQNTPKEAVCLVFEKVNTGGVSLTVFELLTATYAADDFALRDDWEARAGLFGAHPVLAGVEATDFLQVVTLLSTYERRRQHLDQMPEGEKTPAVSCKRRDVLRLTVDEYKRWADVATEALLRVVPFIHGEHIFKARDLPYATQLVPLAAVLAVLGDPADGHGVRQKLRQWYWCGVFGEMYGGSTETRFAIDIQDVVAWIGTDGPEPRTVKDAQFQADRLLSLRSRQSAAYKGLYALQMKRGGQDFRTGSGIDVHAYFDDAIDIHHIFPQKWCSDRGLDARITNCVVNKTAIDARTNRRIGGNAPSVYLDRIESQEGISGSDLDGILSSHDIDPVALRQDDFEGFFNRRFERLLKQIEEAMGKAVNRAADESESPFADQDADPNRTRERVQAVIASGEGRNVEFKSTGRRNLHTGEKDAAIEWSVVKTLAAFLNSAGGTLLVGVDDAGSIVGIEEDFPLLRKQDADGWQLWLTDAVTSALGKPAAAELEVTISAMEGGTVARIDVRKSPRPVFGTPPKGQQHPTFLVRINNSTQELHGQDAQDYINAHWSE